MSIELFNLVERLRGEKKILVSGPCRSGTTIMINILSDLLGYEVIDSFKEDNPQTNARYFISRFGIFLKAAKRFENVIFHGPHFHPFLHRVPKDVCLVFMRRNYGDVDTSSKGLYNGTWTDEFYSERMEPLVEKKHLGFYHKLNYPGKVYFVWDRYQKKKNKNHIEAHYDWVGSHRFFVAKKNRKGFGDRDWKCTTS